MVDANRKYKFTQPKLDYAACLGRIMSYCGQIEMTTTEFQAQAEALKARLGAMPGYANIFRGVHLPICMPKIVIDGDLGEYLEQRLLAAVERAYKAAFPERVFNNRPKGELKDAVAWVTENRYGLFLSRLAKGPTVAWYFPTALQGFSIPADREQMSELAKGFFLSGVIDTSIALAAWCEVLARDGNTPVLDCAANTWQSAGDSLCFSPNGGKLDFGSRGLDAYEYCSGGLLFVG